MPFPAGFSAQLNPRPIAAPGFYDLNGSPVPSASTIVSATQGFATSNVGYAADGSLRKIGVNPLNFMNYRKARANKTQRVKVAWIGDSTFAGVTGPTQTNLGAVQSVPYQVSEILNARGIASGAENRFGVASGSYAALVGATGIDGIRVSGTGWTQSGLLTAGGNGFQSTTVNNTLVFTPRKAVSKYTIYWVNNTAGRTATASAGTSGAIAMATSGVYGLNTTTIDCGSSGLHVLTITHTVGASFQIVGIDGFDDTAGRREITMYNFGISGATATQLSSDDGTPVGRLAMYRAIGPHLTVIEAGVINSWRQSLGVASAKAGVSTIIDNARAANSDVLLYTPRFDGATTADSPIQDLYVQAAFYDLAAEKGVDVWDARGRSGSYAIATAAGFNGDTVHGDIAGLGYGDEALGFVDNVLMRL